MSAAAGAVPEKIAPAPFTALGGAPQPPPRRRPPLRLVLLLLCLALLVGALLFLLGARSLQIDVAARTAIETRISGFAVPLGGRYLLLPGQYQLHVRAEGYIPLHTAITVDERDNQRLQFSLQALPGIVAIDSTPAGASVSIDGRSAGETPLRGLSLPAGTYRLTFSAARHLAQSRELQVSGRGVEQAVAVQLQPAWAELSVDSVPGGATVLVDGTAVGTTPDRIQVLQGERRIALQLPGFASWQQTLQIEAGEDRAIAAVQLRPAAAQFDLDSVPGGANVTLDGEFQGQTPLSLALEPDRDHQLAVFKPGYRRHSETLRLPAGASDGKTVSLRARLGELQLQVQPAEAAVRIDGRPAGRGSRTLSLPAVEHIIEVSLPGYATQRHRLTPRPGLPQRIDVQLLTREQARLAGIEPELHNSLDQTLLLFHPEQSTLADFSLGASRREPGRRANEVLRPVGLRRMFYLQTTEVTNGQFREFQASHNSGQVEGKSLNRDQQPVVQVSWQQAAAFCNWLSRREGLPPFYREERGIITGFDAQATGYRLPTEAEWAWAARARGDQLLTFTWGDDFPPTGAVENYADSSSAFITGRVLNNYSDGHVVTAPVGSFPANHKGLHDLGGNVSEWVHDVYTIPAPNGSRAVDPLGRPTGDNYTIRGAAWTHARLGELRLSYRDYGQAGRDDVGFRIARYAE